MLLLQHVLWQRPDNADRIGDWILSQLSADDGTKQVGGAQQGGLQAIRNLQDGPVPETRLERARGTPAFLILCSTPASRAPCWPPETPPLLQAASGHAGPSLVHLPRCSHLPLCTFRSAT